MTGSQLVQQGSLRRTPTVVTARCPAAPDVRSLRPPASTGWRSESSASHCRTLLQLDIATFKLRFASDQVGARCGGGCGPAHKRAATRAESVRGARARLASHHVIGMRDAVPSKTACFPRGDELPIWRVPLSPTSYWHSTERRP